MNRHEKASTLAGISRRRRATQFLASFALTVATLGTAASARAAEAPNSSIGSANQTIAPQLPAREGENAVIATWVGAIAANLQSSSRFPATDSPFRIAVVCDEGLWKRMEAKLGNAKAAGRQLVLIRAKSGDSIPECEMVFIDDDQGIRRTLPALARRSIVTVGRQPGFLDAGGVFEFSIAPGRTLGIRLNFEALRQTGFTPTAALVRITTGEGRP